MNEHAAARLQKTATSTFMPVRSGALQRSAINQSLVSEVPPIVHEVLRSPGRSLDPATRTFMEPRFGHDFSQVRVHTDARAAESARAVNALAYTVGQQVVFAEGHHTPETPAERRLLAHELTHVVQQSPGNANLEGRLTIALPNDPLETEADQIAKRVVSSEGIADHEAARVATFAPSRLYRQPPNPVGGGGGGTTGLRKIHIDANVIDQINRGNAAVAADLKKLKSSGAQISISVPAYVELTQRGADLQIRKGNELLLDELGVRKVPTGNLNERMGTYEQHATKGVRIQAKDIPMVAAAKVDGAELWSFDKGVKQNAAQLSVSIIPESDAAKMETNPRNYAVARSMFGLKPIEITPDGVVKVPPRGGGPGGPSGSGSLSGGGSSKPQGTPPKSGAPSTTTQTSGTGSRGTTASVGTPDMNAPQVGGPSVRGVGIGAGITLAFQGLNLVLNWINDEIQARRVREALAAIEPGINRSRTTSTNLGVLLLFYYSQVQAPAESLVRPGAVFGHIETATGRTRDEAEDQHRTTPALRQAYRSDTQTSVQTVWVPPLQPAGVSALRAPFPWVAVGTFAMGRAKLQDVEWGGVTGFDDEGESSPGLQAGAMPQFLILRLPRKLTWVNGPLLMQSEIPIEERGAAEGGSVPVVSLDPVMPFSNVAAACVFPADDATDAMFSATPATRDNLTQIRYVNFSRARWVRPENIKVLRRR